MRTAAALILAVVSMAQRAALAASEARCDALGANCLCSNRLDSMGWTKVSGTDWAYESSSLLAASDKPCMNQNNRHWLVIQPQVDPSVVTGLAGYSALRDNSVGNHVTSIALTGAQTNLVTGLVAGRYYFTLSSDWTSTGNGGCTNDKYIQFATPYMTTGGGGLWADNGGGGLPVPGVHDCKNGNWCRIEMHVNFQTGTKTYFVKNVTANTPERSWSNSLPAHGVKDIMDPLHKFRDGSCLGTATYMFVMAAHWAAPTGGERIGPADELEGAGADRLAPAPPLGLTVL